MTAVLKCALLLIVVASIPAEAFRKNQKVVPRPAQALVAEAEASLDASLDASPVGQSRLFLQRSTTTITNYLTTSATCMTTLTCATSAAALTSCRRRRDAVEQHIVDGDSISPSEPDAVEVTAAPEWTSSPPSSFLDLSGSVNQPTEALVSGLGACISGRNIGITILFTTTVTSSTLCQASATETKSYTISGCSPAGITFC